MGHGETVNRILHAAIILFSERGFAETSLRTITGMADVNLAAVNYHFGNKKSLIQAVFGHFLSPFVSELDNRLDALVREPKMSPLKIDELLRILIESLFAASDQINEKPQRFMRLLSLAYTQSQDHLRQFLVHYYGNSYRRYVTELKKTMPHLDDIVFYWRINFFLGAAIFTLSSFESIQAILTAEHDVDMNMDQAIDYMVPALAGLLTAKQ